MKAMIFAAGLGTRLKPLTDHMPKALVPVQGRPLLDHTIDTLLQAGATEIVVNVHHFAGQIKDHLAAHPCPVPLHISDETEQLLDTGGGLLKASALFRADPDPILIHNVDILSNARLAELYQRHLDTAVDAQLLVSPRTSSRYLLFDDDMRLRAWTNVKTGEVRSPYPDIDLSRLHRYAFSGIHTFSPALCAQMKSLGDRFSIIDFYLQACSTADIRGVVDPQLQLLDVGKLDTLHAAEEWFSQRA